MTFELAYLLKVNVAITLFYAFYRLFFCKDTFFLWRRIALLSFFGVALLYPLFNIQNWVKAHEPMAAIADVYAITVLPEYTLEIDSPEKVAARRSELIASIPVTIYLVGAALLLLRILWQLACIVRLHIRCPKRVVDGTRIHLLTREKGAFSFFHWIFLHPDSLAGEGCTEILTHEKTHAGQYHSIDVIVSELMCVCCWFNPFAWLTKREVKNNLEFLADHKVLERGHDSKTYQYHLLQWIHQKAAANLSNSFNVLPLKKRIKMMNKKRTQNVGRTKYAMFVPLAALLMVVSNIEAVATGLRPQAGDTTAQDTIVAKKVTTSTASAKSTLSQDPPGGEIDSKKPLEIFVRGFGKEKASPQAKPQTKVEEMPKFPGGEQGLFKYLSNSIKYPTLAIKNNEQGKVGLQIIIGVDGSLSNIQVIKSVSAALDAEAIRVALQMPKWQPGKDKGKPVAVSYTLSVAFSLE